MSPQYQANYENAALAQKAIEALRLNFNNKKKPSPKRSAYENPPLSAQPDINETKVVETGLCDCCAKEQIPQNLLTKIDSGQVLCSECLAELRPSPTFA
jgi:hypothetical protein